MTNYYPDLTFNSLNIILFTVLGSIGTLCFSHLLGITIRHPLLAQGLFHLPISYFSFFVFNFTPFPIYFLPNILSAYAILRQFDVALELTHPSLNSLQNWFFYLLLIFQTFFYFGLLLFFDMLLHRHLRPRSSPLP